MSMMNIYLISQNTNPKHYDTYDSAVVIAESEESARHMHPNGKEPVSSDEVWWKVEDEYWSWAHPRDVKVVHFGITDSHKKQVICASFNAG